MIPLDAILARLDATQAPRLERLFALMRIASVSTDPAFAADCQRAAALLRDDLAAMGFRARLVGTPGHPFVLAHWPEEIPGQPRGLFYGHYDVQPVDPLEAWSHDPFAPCLRPGPTGAPVISGRGASDDKGQLMTFLEALRACIAATGAPPINLTLLFEGEEETGSPSLLPFLRDHRAELAADFAMACDTGMWRPDTPAITAALRGMLSVELTLQAADRDVHSGLYGGAAANPIHVLSRMLADLHDDAGRVTLPGFYDGVAEIPPAIAADWEAMAGDWPDPLGDIGLSRLAGEPGRSFLNLTWARPTAEVNGIRGGYAGAGFKTVLPAQAAAKLSFRLVAGQAPEAVAASLETFLRARLPADCRLSITRHGAARAVQLPWDAPLLARARAALDAEWPRPARITGCGGSIPAVAAFAEVLGLDTLMVGFSLPDDRVHAPDEKFDLAAFDKGSRSWARILASLAEPAEPANPAEPG